MIALFDQLQLVSFGQEVYRNIASLRQSQNLFDDLAEDPELWMLAQKIESEVKPLSYQSTTPVINRPFEDAEWFNAIAWPFKHWQSSRYSDGSYGVWYGSAAIETTVFESAFHWYRGLICDAGFERQIITAERTVYSVACTAALLDFRSAIPDYPELVDPWAYTFCQLVGAKINREGHPGLLTHSVRQTDGENVVIFNPNVLSNPRKSCHLTYV
jgi:hypothetical protein